MYICTDVASSPLILETAGSFETLVHIYQTTLHHTIKDGYLHNFLMKTTNLRYGGSIFLQTWVPT
jgi:hypothetical protein